MAGTRRHIAYRLVVLLTMGVCVLAGAILLVAFVQSTILPAAASGGRILGTNYWGSYLAGVSGGLFLVWACLLGLTVRQPLGSRAIANVSAAGLLLLGLVNLAARFSGEYGEAGEWQRLATTATALLALALIWLAPTPPQDGEE